MSLNNYFYLEQTNPSEKFDLWIIH